MNTRGLMASFDINHFEKMESYIPIDLSSLRASLTAFAVILFFIVFRYFLLTGAAYLYFWKFRGDAAAWLHDRKLSRGQIAMEIKWSMVSSLLFALSGIAIGWAWQKGYSVLYLEFDALGLFYLPLSFWLYALFHEIYFYGTHVAMHWPRFYRKVHLVHHKSIKTSPWASFSFHPWEALVHALFLPLMTLWLPIHPLVLIAYLTFMTVTAISNHLGVEIIPFSGVRAHFISGEHHALHHAKANCNFGLYSTFLDRYFGTEAIKKTQPQVLNRSTSIRTVYE